MRAVKSHTTKQVIIQYPDKIVPITYRQLIKLKIYRQMFPLQRTGFVWLCRKDIYPEHIVFSRVFHPELMLCILAGGLWVDGDWRPRVRLAIAHRLKELVNYPGFLPEPFDKVKKTLLKVQLHGGSFTDHAILREMIAWAQRSPEALPQHHLMAKIMRVLIEDPQWSALMYPMWWIRIILLHTDPLVTFGWCKVRWEQEVQKEVLCKMIYADLPPGVF